MSPVHLVRDCLHSASKTAFPGGLIKEEKEQALPGTCTLPADGITSCLPLAKAPLPALVPRASDLWRILSADLL